MVYTSFNKGFVVETKQKEDIFNNIPDVDVSNISDNIEEATSTLMYETEVNWNSLMRAVGLLELTSVEKYGEVIYEAWDIKAFFGKIKEFFVKLFEKIKAIFTRVMLHIKQIFRSSAPYLNDPKLKYLKVPENFTYEYQEITNLDYEFSTDHEAYFKKADILLVPDYCLHIPNGKYDEDAILGKFIRKYRNKENVNSAMNSIRGEMLSTSSLTKEDFKTSCDRFFKKGKPYTLNNKNLDISKHIEILNDAQIVKRLESSYDDMKYAEKSILDTLEFSTGITKVMKDFTEEPIHKQQTEAYAIFYELVKEFYTDLTILFNAKLAAAKTYIMQSEQIMRSLLVANKLKYKDSVKL